MYTPTYFEMADLGYKHVPGQSGLMIRRKILGRILQVYIDWENKKTTFCKIYYGQVVGIVEVESLQHLKKLTNSSIPLMNWDFR